MEPCPLFDSTDPECLECPDNPDAIIPVEDVETGELADLHVGTVMFLAKRTMDMEHESALIMDAYREALAAWRRAWWDVLRDLTEARDAKARAEAARLDLLHEWALDMDAMLPIVEFMVAIDSSVEKCGNALVEEDPNSPGTLVVA